MLKTPVAGVLSRRLLANQRQLECFVPLQVGFRARRKSLSRRYSSAEPISPDQPDISSTWFEWFLRTSALRPSGMDTDLDLATVLVG